MSLLKYAIAAAVGYYVGQPDGRRRVEQLRQQATEFLRSPKAAELKEQGRAIAGERASAAVDKVRSASGADPGSGPDSGSGSGFGGRTVVEDSDAVRTGVQPPGPATRPADEE